MPLPSLPPTLFDVAADAARKWGDSPFLVIGRRAEVLTFADLAEQADLLARVLVQEGVVPGTCVGIWITNHVEWPVAAYAVSRAGGVTVAISSRLTARELAHMLRLSGAAVVVMEDQFLGKVDAAAIFEEAAGILRREGLLVPKIIQVSRGGFSIPGALDWADAMRSAGNLPSLPPAGDLVGRMAAHDPELDGVAAILSTSGTTGAPKGVMLGHSGLIRLAYNVGVRQELRPGEKFYSVGPFFHCSGYMHGLLTNLVAGSTYYTTPSYSADETWDVVTGEGVTAYHGFVGALQDMADQHAAERDRLSHFQRAWYSSPAAKMAMLEDTLGTLQCEVYGLTEVGGNLAICTKDDPVAMRHDSDGRPHDGLEVRIVAEDGCETPEGNPGEIQIRGWNVMSGYYRDSAATSRAVVDGWLRTGDQGVRLPGGYVKFLSRLKDVIRVGGENLSPLEVEEVLVSHPTILEAAVVAAPDNRLTEVPVAFIRLRAGAALDAVALDAFCRARLAKFKVPRDFLVVDDFPRTGATNRIIKQDLRAMIKDRQHA